MLVLVRAFARERAGREAAASLTAQARERWVSYYLALARQAPVRLRGAGQLAWMRRLDAESENLASVMRHLLDSSRLDEAAEYAWSLYLYLWVAGLLGVVRDWMAELLDRSEQEGLPLAPRTEAIALYYTRAVAFWQDPDLDVRPGLERSAALFDEAGEPFGAALSRVSLALGHLAAPTGPDVVAARGILQLSLEGFARAGDPWGQAMTHVTLGRIDLVVQDIPAPRRTSTRAAAWPPRPARCWEWSSPSIIAAGPSSTPATSRARRRTSPRRWTCRSRCATTRGSRTACRG